MNVQHGGQARIVVRVLAAAAVVVSWAGAVAPAWPSARPVTAGAGPPGARVIGPTRLAGSWSWGRAIEVPGLRAMNKGASTLDVTGVYSVSCGAAGDCAAGGSYRDGHRRYQGFVTSRRHGHWGKAIQTPGLGALYGGRDAGVSQVSCGAAGNCVAVGGYTDRRGHGQGFVIAERHGRWGKAIKIPGLEALNAGAAYVASVSCASAGNCAVVGLYTDRSGHRQMFAASQRHGHWGKAIGVPGLGALAAGGNADVYSVSCGAPGSCAAIGDYTDRRLHSQGFVATERNGHWAKAIEIPGLGLLNKGGDAAADSVSCGAAGSCAAVGGYTDGYDSGQGFVAAERNGHWGKAIELPGLGALNGGSNANVASVSCASAGNCAVTGTYGGPYGLGFVADEKNGHWGKAISVPGLAALTGRYAEATSVSCASPGNCAAVGYYSDELGGVTQGFVAAERNGRWGKAIKIPGLAALNKGGGVFTSEVSCAQAGGCAAGGSYTDRHQHFQGFVVSQTR